MSLLPPTLQQAFQTRRVVDSMGNEGRYPPEAPQPSCSGKGGGFLAGGHLLGGL